MSILRLNIDQQFAAIGVRSTPARMNIAQPRPQIRISNQNTQLQIDTQAPSFRVNRTKINNESGLKAPLELAKDFRNKGRQAALRGARQAKDDGNFIANPHIPGDKSIPALARNKAMSRLGTREFNVGLMPASSPEVTWQKGDISINWSKHSIVVDCDGAHMPRVTLAPKHSVDVFLRTQPYFRVSIEQAVNTRTLGRFIDRSV